MKIINFKMVLVACMLPSTAAYAQYPQITDEAQHYSDSLGRISKAHRDSAWAVALPVVIEEAKQGRPYAPWASRPYDLRQARIPAFPGAEGGGMYTFGGRGGKVLTVTNLNDSGPGSFRWACEQGGARIIVFNVSGIIWLKSPISVQAPYITIAGQTAPGEGVCIAGETFNIDTHDVIVRHMRFRRGKTSVWSRDDSFGGNPVGNIMIDHCSCEWGLDENISFYRHMFSLGDGKERIKTPTVNVTIQNTISAKALDNWNHSFGSTIGGENTTFMRNLWASNTGRNPSIGWGGAYRIIAPESRSIKMLPYRQFGRVYATGNIMEGYPEVTRDNWNGGIQLIDKDGTPGTAEELILARSNEPFEMAPVTIMDTQEAYEWVLQYRRLPNDSYKLGIITDPRQMGGYPEYKRWKPYVDTDMDGMPDDWEKAHGLNPNDPTDANGDLNGDGYTNIEKYINGIGSDNYKFY